VLCSGCMVAFKQKDKRVYSSDLNQDPSHFRWVTCLELTSRCVLSIRGSYRIAVDSIVDIDTVFVWITMQELTSQ